jgi:hypothetical protein
MESDAIRFVFYATETFAGGRSITEARDLSWSDKGERHADVVDPRIAGILFVGGV